MTIAEKHTETGEDIAEAFFIDCQLRTVKNGGTFSHIEASGTVQAVEDKHNGYKGWIYYSSKGDKAIKSGSSKAVVKAAVKAAINSQDWVERQVDQISEDRTK
jgi:hypothetical protein